MPMPVTFLGKSLLLSFFLVGAEGDVSNFLFLVFIFIFLIFFCIFFFFFCLKKEKLEKKLELKFEVWSFFSSPHLLNLTISHDCDVLVS